MENLKKSKEKRLKPKQKKAIEMLVYQGMSHKCVANVLEISESTLSVWLNQSKNPEFVEAYEKEIEIAESMRKRNYKVAAKKAQERLFELMDDEKSDVALRACKEILDRAGDKPVETVNVNTSEKLSEIFEQIGGGGGLVE